MMLISAYCNTSRLHLCQLAQQPPFILKICHVAMTAVTCVLSSALYCIRADFRSLKWRWLTWTWSIAIKEMFIEMERRKVKKKNPITLRRSHRHTAIRPSDRKWRPHASCLHFLSFLSTFLALWRELSLKSLPDQSFWIVSVLLKTLFGSYSDSASSDLCYNCKKNTGKWAKIMTWGCSV